MTQFFYFLSCSENIKTQGQAKFSTWQTEYQLLLILLLIFYWLARPYRILILFIDAYISVVYLRLNLHTAEGIVSVSRRLPWCSIVPKYNGLYLYMIWLHHQVSTCVLTRVNMLTLVLYNPSHYWLLKGLQIWNVFGHLGLRMWAQVLAAVLVNGNNHKLNIMGRWGFGF